MFIRVTLTKWDVRNILPHCREKGPGRTWLQRPRLKEEAAWGTADTQADAKFKNTGQIIDYVYYYEYRRQKDSLW